MQKCVLNSERLGNWRVSHMSSYKYIALLDQVRGNENYIIRTSLPYGIALNDYSLLI